MRYIFFCNKWRINNEKSIDDAIVLGTACLNTQIINCMDPQLKTTTLPPSPKDGITNPLTTWKITNHINQFDLNEYTNYLFIWNEKLLLAENQEVLLLNIVCSSFVFLDKKTPKATIPYLVTISQNPEGCELLRIIATKYSTFDLPKIQFILDESDVFFANTLYDENHHMIPCIFVPINHNPKEMCTIKKQSNTKLRINIENIPPDVFLYYSLAYCYNKICKLLDKRAQNIESDIESEKFDQNTVIISRSKQIQPFHKQFFYRTDEAIENAWISFFNNDEDFATMYGIRSTTNENAELSLLNLSTYTASVYKFILPFTADVLYDTIFNQTLSIAFLIECGDKELYEYYLLYHKPLVPRPTFGIGQYKCSDYSPETGKKLIVTQEQATTSAQ